MKKISYFLLVIFFCFIFFSFSSPASARDNVDYWYIKDFRSEIQVNTDSSLDIVEYITADCGTAQKHGIYRILPTAKQLDDSMISMPVTLVSISDFQDNPLKYQTTKNAADHTVTWKIGDGDVYVSGVNYYKIHYKIKNAILHSNDNFDEFYWNLSGNFWDIPIDHFEAQINLPDDIDNNNSSLEIYAGAFGENDSSAYSEEFSADHLIKVEVEKTMESGEGITASLTFPKDIIQPYVPTFWERNGKYFFLLLPAFFLYIFYVLWRKYGRDPRVNMTVAPEFEIPEKLSPIDMNVLMQDGRMSSRAISASIINLAVKGKIKIEKIEKKGVFDREDFDLVLLKDSGDLGNSEKILLKKIFPGGSKRVKMSSLKNKFFKNIPDIQSASRDYLVKNKWLIFASRIWQAVFVSVAIVFAVISFSVYEQSPDFAGNLLLTAMIIFIFSFLMRSRSEDGAILLRRVRGFKLYMKTAEKYRQKFNEKENIFERFLPYAVLFGIAELWAKKMKMIYGDDYFNSYHPIWFVGAGRFDAGNFASEISSVSSSMAATMASSPSSSGSGGGGFSGGGGGGGGGGGW